MDFEQVITVFYNKADRVVCAFCSGIQGLSYLGKDLDELSKSYDMLYVDKEKFNENLWGSYKVIGNELTVDKGQPDSIEGSRLNVTRV